MNDRQELVLLLREVMRWEKRMRDSKVSVATEGAEWNNFADILNRAHVAISTDSRKRERQRPQRRC